MRPRKTLPPWTKPIFAAVFLLFGFMAQAQQCPNMAANVGDPCDDNRPYTTNDVVIMNSGGCMCLGADMIPTSVDIRLVPSAQPNKLDLQVMLHSTEVFGGVLSALTVTIRYDASAGAALGGGVEFCPAWPLDPEAVVTNSGMAYRTYNGFGLTRLDTDPGPFDDEGCGATLPVETWFTVSTIPYSAPNCVTFTLGNDAFTGANNRDFYLSMNGWDRTGNVIGGPVQVGPCSVDCAGVPGGTAYLDNCNQCVGGTTGNVPCTQDCNGDWGGTASLDNCGTCAGGNTGVTPCTQDCNGDWGGTASVDNCGTCAGGNTGVTPCTQDCNGDGGGPASVDNCGTCAGGNTGVTPCTQDCNGDWGGTAYMDNCATCVGGNTGLEPCVSDCNGVPGGSAFVDNCGTCVGGDTGLEACVQDCNGDWGGTASLDNCGTCTGGNTGVTPCTQDCNGDWGGTAYMDNCATCVGGNTGLEPCSGPCTGNEVVVVIHADGQADQLSWVITNDGGTTIASGALSAGQNNSTVSTTACLGTTNDPACYGFRLMDSFGDGISNGGWELKTTSGRLLLQDAFASGAVSPASPSATAAYGSSHSFCLPEGPARIKPTSCGIFTYGYYGQVFATKVVGATQYQFEFSDPDAGYVRRIARPHEWVGFHEMSTKPLVPGVVYFARVRTDRDGPLASAHFGAGCELGMGIAQTVLCTQLIEAPSYGHSCNETRIFNHPYSFIYAKPVGAATSYTFWITGDGGLYDHEFTRSTYILHLGWSAAEAPPLVNGSTYQVRVKVAASGVEGTYCGNTCDITINNSPVFGEMAVPTMGNATLWPNPARDGQVNLSIDGIQDLDQQITVDVQDIYGKQVFAQEFGNSGDRFSTILQLPKDIATGVYMVNITVNGERSVQRLSIIK